METKTNKQQVVLQVADKGPLLVKGPVNLITSDGKEITMDKAAICRCGKSKNQPFCDGSHAK